MISIRRAELSDLKKIQDLNHELFRHDNAYYHDLNLDWPYETDGEAYFRKCITEHDRLISLVAEQDEKIIGYLNGCIQKPYAAVQGIRAEIENMCVADSFRSHGIGTQLIDEFKKWAKTKKADYLFVGAYAKNTRAIAFYQNNGFEPYELRQWQKLS